MRTVELSKVFLAAWHDQGAAPPRFTLELEATLAGFVRASLEAWPSVAVASDVFVRHLARQASRASEPERFLSEVHAAELYLCCACATGDRVALELFEAKFMGPLQSHLKANPSLVPFIEDIKQAVRVDLLFAPAGQVPKIASFEGRGALSAWLRVIAIRTGVHLRRAHLQQPQSMGERDPSSISADPELDLVKRQYREEFSQALTSVLGGLETKERNIIRMHFLDGMTAIQIGALHRVSARTVQRWIAEARATIVAKVTEALKLRLDLSQVDLEGLLGLVESQLAVSLFTLYTTKRD